MIFNDLKITILFVTMYITMFINKSQIFKLTQKKYTKDKGTKMFFQCINLVLFPFTYDYVYGGYCFAILGRDCGRGGVARKRF